MVHDRISDLATFLSVERTFVNILDTNKLIDDFAEKNLDKLEFKF